MPCFEPAEQDQRPETGYQRPRRRGGQPGNLNALKTGARSEQLAALFAALHGNRATRDLMVRFAQARRRLGFDHLGAAVSRHNRRVRARRRALANIIEEARAYGRHVDRLTRKTNAQKSSRTKPTADEK